MTSRAKRGLHWFRNDLRLRDNLALAALSARVDEWLPVFVLDGAFGGETPGLPRTSFLLDCVKRLRDELSLREVELLIVAGDARSVIPALLEATGADTLSFSEADTPRGRRRDEAVCRAVSRLGGRAFAVRNHTVFGPGEIRTKTGGLYSVFTPYRNAWWRAWKEAPRVPARRIELPKRAIGISRSVRREFGARLPHGTTEVRLPSGGEAAAARRLKGFLAKRAAHYAEDRDIPALDGTSRLSAHLRFGTISPRRCVATGLEAAAADPGKAGGIGKWLDEIVWREFYASLLANSPHMLTRNLRAEYDPLDWTGSDEHFEAWCCGRTGYPIVDAGMRQLNETGWMHNRVRMIVGSFLVKDLSIDWRRGARYFFDRLVDGDPASNSGGWQWVASTGSDAQPYFRIFNPESQGRKWDPHGDYVRRFVPELRGVDEKFIHAPWRSPIPPDRYPAPIVDHAVARTVALENYRRARAVGAASGG